MTAEKILTLARAELGNREFPPSSNTVKYNTAYYGRTVSGSNYAWCAVFIWWLFKQAGASNLYYGGQKTAYCPALMSYHTKQAVFKNYKPGDIVFFNFSGKANAAHVGICESWDGTYITTIDGNTGTGNEANGGAVMRRKRHKKYIVGAYRPKYEELTEMDENKVLEIVRKELDKRDLERANKAGSSWAKVAWNDATARGITDGTRPRDYVTREECAAMVMSGVRFVVAAIKTAIESMK